MNDTNLTYQERAAVLNAEARNMLLESAGELYLKARHAAGSIGELEIVCVNRMREAGVKLNLASGHEQLMFNVDGLKFCREKIIPNLPEGMGMNQIKVCVHLANNLPHPVQTRDEMVAVKRELQMVMSALGLQEIPKRKELQTAHTRNLLADCYSRAASLVVLFDQIESEQPMEDWPDEKLDEYIENFSPVKERVVRAEKLRLGTA